MNRWDGGNGVVAFNAGEARSLGFSAHHEPEDGNEAHANVYCDHPEKERKRQARKLAALCQVRCLPSPVAG